MKIRLNESEKELLKIKGIDLNDGQDLSEEEAEDVLDRVRDVEVYYSQQADNDSEAKEQAIEYGNLADKIQEIIDEN